MSDNQLMALCSIFGVIFGFTVVMLLHYFGVI